MLVSNLDLFEEEEPPRQPKRLPPLLWKEESLCCGSLFVVVLNLEFVAEENHPVSRL